LKPKKLSPKVISDLHRHVWWLINLRDGINHEARQVQLCADIANLLAPYGIDATIHRHWTVPMNDNRVDVFLSYWEPGKMSASVASEIIEFHNVSDTLLSRMRLYVEFRRFFRRLQSKLFSATLSELTGQAGENLPRSSVANEGFAPLCGAAAISMAALKTPVASEGGESRASVGSLS
jgi:hypothetical protein